MAKPPKKVEPDRTKEEAQKLFEQTVKTMLNTPPRPHEPLGKKRRPSNSKPRDMAR
jgi:hypothetical protein